METIGLETIPHPKLREALFARRRETSHVFRDVMGLHDVNHIGISRVDSQQRLLIFSSTPSLEFNLFNSSLWRFDKTYNPAWYTQCTLAKWPSLYDLARYEELYYYKQIKTHYPTGLSLAMPSGNGYYIFSLASHRPDLATQTLFTTAIDDFRKIGLYCMNRLSSCFQDYDL